MYHGQKEAGLWNGAKTWSCWVLIGDSLQGNRLHTWVQEQAGYLAISQKVCMNDSNTDILGQFPETGQL